MSNVGRIRLEGNLRLFLPTDFVMKTDKDLVFWIFHDKIFSVRLFAIYLEYASFGIIIFFQRWKRFIVVEQGGNCGCMKML